MITQEDRLSEHRNHLKETLTQASEHTDGTAPSPLKAKDIDLPPALEKRCEMLEDVPAATIRKAWFTLAHLLLPTGAKIADMGSDDGALAYTMAVLYPDYRIFGVDKDKRAIKSSVKKWQAPNLEFVQGDATNHPFPEGSMDAIVNSYILYEIYSNSYYNEQPVVDTLKNEFAMLKDGGMLFIRDYARPPPEEFVLIEMPDAESMGDTLPELSEADLLIWYSEHARPREGIGCGGFFLEELPPRIPDTRLFRVPYKWAYEFIMRKDDRQHWETELPKEYTFFTVREYRKQMRAMGARVLYSAPQWNEKFIRERSEGHFRLFKEDGTPLGHPPTSYIFLAQKIGERKSLLISERRPSNKTGGSLHIEAMRDEKTGRITEIVSRDVRLSDLLPYRLGENGRIKLYLRESVARPLVNAVPRKGKSLDGKKWSGHMYEAFAVNMDEAREAVENGYKGAVMLARDYLGMKPGIAQELEKGPCFYPAPDYLDERIETWYLNVEEPTAPPVPRKRLEETEGFSVQDTIREYDAQHVLNAIYVGYIPSSRLEVQILSLFETLGQSAESWLESPLELDEFPDEDITDLDALLRDIPEKDERFKEIRGYAGHLRTIRSSFVDEGYIRSSVAGLAAKDVEFVIHDDHTINTAVILPLARNKSNEVLAGFIQEFLPVPQRHKGSGRIIRAPSLHLPKNITDTEQAKKYIADKFDVTPDRVAKLGESYFNHLGMTPQKIFPFAVAPRWGGAVGGGDFKEGKFSGWNALAPIHKLWKFRYWDVDDNHHKMCCRTMQVMCHDTDLAIGTQFNETREADYAKEAPTYSAPLFVPGIPSSPMGGDSGGGIMPGTPVVLPPSQPSGPENGRDHIKQESKTTDSAERDSRDSWNSESSGNENDGWENTDSDEFQGERFDDYREDNYPHPDAPRNE